jgi:hypothetical protein
MTTYGLQGSSLFQRALRISSALLVALLAMLLFSSAAHAQGTSGSLPDPVSSRDLDRIMDQLELDEAQRRVAETHHEQYIEEFKRLREGEIEEYMQKMREFQGTMPARKKLEDFLAEMSRLQDKIGRLDNQLFDQLMAALRDDQQITLTRVRMQRARERSSGDMMQMVGFLVPAASVDLSEIYNKLRLTPDEKLMIQTTVMDYESKLTRSSKEMAESLLRMFIDIFDIIEAAGFDENSFQDPEQAQEAFNIMREAWATVSVKLMAKAMEISDLNRRSCKRISEMLLQDHRERLVDQYYEQAYPELPTSNLRQLFRKALRHNDLTEDQWMNVSVLRDDFRRQELKLYDDMADIQDALRATRSPFNMGGMGGQEIVDDEAVDKLAELTERHEKLVERTTEALNVHLGADLQVKIIAMEDPLEQEAMAEAAAEAAANAEAQAFEVAAAVSRSSGDQPISAGEFRQSVMLLQLDEASQAVAEQLHQAYFDRFTTASEELQGKVQEAQSKMWTYDQATSSTRGPTTAQVQEIHELRKNAAKALREVDESFFREVAATCGADSLRQEQLERLRTMRLRSTFVSDGDMWIWGFGAQHSQVARLDLIALCVEERLLDEPNEALRSALATYDMNITQAMRTRYERGLDAQHQMEVANAAFTAANQESDGEDSGAVAAGVRYQQVMQELSRKLTDASKEVIRLNIEMLTSLRAALPEDAAARFEKAYKRQAYPSVYRGAEAVELAMTKLRALNSLSATQREKLEDVLTEFEVKHEALCDRMVTIVSDWSGSAPFETGGMREYQRIDSAMQKLEFEREELTARARRRVQDLLSDDQLAQVGGLFARRTAATATP